MIAWKSMDERERAVWSATVAAAFATRHLRGRGQEILSQAVGVADDAVEAMREYMKDWPPIGEEQSLEDENVRLRAKLADLEKAGYALIEELEREQALSRELKDGWENAVKK